MRFQSYPSLINRQIIQEMDPSANFMLAKTSKKMKDLVKNNIYKVDQVWVNFDSNWSFVVEIGRKIYKVFDLKAELAPKEMKWYRFLVNKVLLHSSAVQEYHEILTNHNDICDIFKRESNKISVIDENQEFVDEYSARFLTRVDFCNIKMVGCPPTMTTPNLIIDDVNVFFMDFIYNYEGQNIVLKKTWLSEGYVRSLILDWIAKEKENLVTFIAFQDDRKGFNESSVVNLLNSKRNAITDSRVEDWDPEKRDRYFKYASIIANHHVFPADTFDCKHGYDIVREDGKRATVKISPNYFMFFVWP